MGIKWIVVGFGMHLIISGTRTLNFFHGNSCGDDSTFLIAVKEQPIDQFIHNRVYGICFVDTCVGAFHVGYSYNY